MSAPETPFRLHRQGLRPWDPTPERFRFATVAELRRVLACDYNQRLWGEWFFPLYLGQEKADIERWLEAYDALQQEAA